MRRSSLLALSASVIALVGCQPKDRAVKRDSAVPAQSGKADPAAPNVVTVHAREYSFDIPAEIPAGVTTFQLVNDGTMLHHLQLVRLDSGKTAADLDAAMKKPGAPPPRWAVFVGGPNAPDPTGQSNTTLELIAGNYIAICVVDIPGGVPHFAKGMVHPFTVTPSRATVQMPVADVNVALADYGFTVSKPLTAGKHLVSLTNTATQPHEIEIVKLAPGKTQADFMKWISKYPNVEGPPPGNAIGGTAAFIPGMKSVFSADFTPGDYLFICFVPDMKDGKPHLAHGMIHAEKVS